MQLSAWATKARARRRAERQRLRDGMRAAALVGATHQEIAQAVGMKRPTVTQIISGRRWSVEGDDAL